MASRFPRLPLRELLASIDSGWSPRCETSPAGPDEWGVLKVSAVTWGTYRQEENKRLPSDLDPRPEVEVSAGDLLMSRANTQELVGRAVLVRETRPKLMMSDKLLRLRVNAQADVRFVLALLAAPDTREQIELAASGSSGSMKNISQDKLGSLIVPVPPLPEQRKIAAILSAVDEVIEKTEAVIESLQALKKAMMQELLTRGLPGRHTRFKQTEIGEVPEEWEVCTLGDISREKPRYGANVSKGGFDPQLPRYVRITDIDEHGALRDDDLASITERDAVPYMLAEGDILLARSGATVGKSYVYDAADGRCAHAGYLICFKPDPSRARTKFVGLVLQSQRFWQWVKDSQRAQAQPNINAAEYASFLLPIPVLDEQLEIESRFDAFDNRRKAEVASLEGLRLVKSSLSSVLLTGELRVTPDQDAA